MANLLSSEPEVLNENSGSLAMESDIFAPLLSLEDQYYNEGYTLGVLDGTRAGRTEGRLFGLEQGFDKFLEMGRLAGKAAVWEGRIEMQHSKGTSEGGKPSMSLQVSERARRNVARLVELTDPATLSTSNNEDAVADFDERLAGAKAKERLIMNAVGEHDLSSSGNGVDAFSKRDGGASDAREDGDTARRLAKGGGGEMEDFAGLPRTSTKKDR